MKVDAIFVSDFHIREDKPICRIDNFNTAQWSKLEEIKAIQYKHDCPVLHAGDLFNHWKPSPHLLSMTMERIPSQLHTVFGNHDLPDNNLNKFEKSGIHTLQTSKHVEVLSCLHWEQDSDTKSASIIIKDKKILVWHIMTYQGKEPWPGCTDSSGIQILRKYHSYFDVIVTGHNHKSFVEEYKGCLLVNPGSMTRMKADEEDHQPSVYLWSADTNEVKRHFLNTGKNVISRSHITKQKEKNEAYLSDETWSGSLNEIDISFKQNIERRLSMDDGIRKPVKTIIYESLG